MNAEDHFRTYWHAIPAVLAFNIFQRLLKRVIGRSNALGNAIASGMHAKGNNGRTN